MSLSAILRAAVESPSGWTKTTMNEVLWKGNLIYGEIKSRAPTLQYLLASDFRHLEPIIDIKGSDCSFLFDEDPVIFGVANAIKVEFGVTLEQGISDLFATESSGILIADGYSYGLMKHDDNYIFFNSHSTDANGYPAPDGSASITVFSDLNLLIQRASRTISKTEVFTIDRIAVQIWGSDPISKRSCQNEE